MMRLNKIICLFSGLCILSFAFAAESLALQQARPTSDIRTGNWSPTGAGTLSDTVNETSANDGDYMSTATRDDIAELELDPLAPPDPGTRTLRIRGRSSSRFNAVEVALLSNGYPVQQFTVNLSRWNWTTASLEITNAIPNYSTLSVEIVFKRGGRGGSAYVSWVEFEVPDPSPVIATLPALSIPTSISITQDSATLGATLTDTGSSSVTQWGIVWSTSPNPTTSVNEGSCTASGPYTTGNPFTCSATGLTLNTPYYFAGYAINSNGTGYSGQGQFATLDIERIGHNYDVAPLLSTPLTMINCDTCHALHSGVVPTGDDVFTACEKCHVAGGEADSMSDIANHIVTRESDGATITVDCGMCHEMHKKSLISEDTHAGGITTRNNAYIRVDMTEYISGAYSGDTVLHNNFNGVPISGEQPGTFSYGNSNAPYNGVCQSCHTDTKYHKNDGTAEDHKKDTNCRGCHTHNKSGTSDAFLGRGHATNDTLVRNSPNCSPCHPTPNNDPVMEIHRENCATCHINPDGDGPLHEPWATNNPNGGTCEDCHFSGGNVGDRGTGHHAFSRTVPASAADNGQAEKGLCINCHLPDVGNGPVDPSTLALGNISGNNGLACNYCHIYWANGNNYSTPVKIYNLGFDPDTNPSQPPTKLALGTHTISLVNDPPISDYAACFACHGKTSFEGSQGITSTKVVPWHGLGQTYTDGNDRTTGGDADDVINMFWGPVDTGNSQPKRTNPIHPGAGAFNQLKSEIEVGYRNYSNSRSRRYFHRNDDNAHDTNEATYQTTIEIPWDDYAPGAGSTPGNASLNAPSWGTNNKDTVMPVVPLTLP